jgi:hypothetical protein
MLILQLKKRIEILEAKVQEHEHQLIELIAKLSVPTAPTLIPKEKETAIQEANGR